MMPEPPLQPSLPQAGSVPFDVVALVTAAGGLEALSAVLRDLPSPFPAAVIEAQRLSGNGRTLVHILGRRTTLPVTWMHDGVTLAPGQVWVCPPGHRLELLPDGTCSLSPHEGGARNRSHDFFLESLADSFGKRALVTARQARVP